MLDHFSGRIHGLLHFIELAQVGDHLVAGPPAVQVGGDVQADQMLVGVEGDGRVGKAHQVAVLFVVEERHHVALLQGVLSKVQQGLQDSFLHGYSPILTLSKRQTGTPCPSCMIWLGCPLPQLSTYLTCQVDGSPTAESEFQNGTVAPL